MIIGDNPGVTAIMRALPPSLTASVDGDYVHAISAQYRWLFRSVWIGEGFPSDLQRAEQSVLASPVDAVNVFTARKISSGTRQRLDERNNSWADLTGRAHIEAEPAFFVDRLPQVRPKSPTGVKWSESAGTVAEVLLQQHSSAIRAPQGHVEPMIVHADKVSYIAGVSYPQVNKVLQQLEADGHIEKHGSRGSSVRRRLINPSSLLSEWAGWHKNRQRQSIGLHTMWRSTEASIERIESHIRRADWAVTEWVGSDILAPFVTSVPSLACYVAQSEIDQLLKRLTSIDGMELTDEGARVKLIPAEPYILKMSDSARSVPVVSPVRLYGDLLRMGGRAEESAEHLREVAIGY